MYLKSLTLKGFKSFADRAHLVLEPGLTVIVGPNGSGKSNVSDAILWVLGEQSAKQLRGAAMEDVVFAGSSARKPVSVAEVTLVLDNSDHTLPIEFEEVALTRRMFRSGESEYLINGSPARLLDFTDILHDSGLGKDTHSIIGQGKLDAILTSRPEERRSLIEEAAGISKHKRRRARAERKLASMDANLARALDVQREVTKRLRPLERQVVRAKRANEVAARLSELKRILAVDDLRRLQQRWGQVESAEREAAAELEVADYRVRQTTDELDKLNGMLEEKGLFVGDLSEQRRKFESAVERLAAGRRLLDEKARSMHARRSELAGAVARAKARRGELAGELAEAVLERDANAGEVAALKDRQREADARLKQAKAARRAAESALSEGNARVRSAQRAANDAALALSKARSELDGARVQDDLFSSRLNQLDVTLAQTERDLAEGTARLESIRAELDAARSAETSARIDADAAREAHASAQAAESVARRELADAEARLSGLERAARDESNAAPLAARIDALVGEGDDVRCRASEALEVPEDLAGLVETLLGGRLSAFVASGPDAFDRVGCAAHGLASSSAGLAYVVDAQDRPDAARDGGLPGWRLADRIGARDGSAGAVEALLGDVRVVDSPEQALEASRSDRASRYTVPDGSFVACGGVASIGRGLDVHAGVLERQRSIRELQASVPELKARAEESRSLTARAEESLATARDTFNERSAAAARLAGEVASCANEVGRLEKSHARSLAERDQAAAQRAEAAARAAAAGESAQRLEAALGKANSDLADANDAVAGLQERFDAARREDGSAHGEVNDCQVALARAQGKTGGLESKVARLQRESDDLARTSARSCTELAGLEVRCDRLAPLGARYDDAIAAASERLDLVRDRARIAEADSATLKATIEGARAAAAAANKAYTDALGRTGEIKVEKGRLDVQVDEAVKAITSQRGVVLEEALQLPPPVDRAADEAEVASLEEALAGIGPVNQVAMEEYDELKARADYITEQVEDLQHARRDLDKILSAIDRKMRSSFLETFDRVNSNFQEVFSMLFPGGRGYIEMTDPENPQECGIEVVAQPRGKRITKMSLLSGGERSLTVLGLLFAVYRTRTVPFYVLDEVEAALDDSNLDRLLAAIDALRDVTQLIVISHQRRTMERADVLYGVSMQADGVSRVVSQKLDGRGNVVDAND